jgi:Icc-related predicted phosphoesterase
MKILTFVDTHGNKTAINKLLSLSKKVDLLVCAGDLTNFGEDLNKILKILEKTNKPLLIIHGNHESEQLLKQAKKKFKFIKFIHNKVYTINNYAFFGYGGGGFEQEDKSLEALIPKIKKETKGKILTFITHQPPYNTKLDIINKKPAGSKSITKFIQELSPKFNICGHLHENINKKDRINKTFIINPGFGKVISL